MFPGVVLFWKAEVNDERAAQSEEEMNPEDPILDFPPDLDLRTKKAKTPRSEKEPLRSSSPPDPGRSERVDVAWAYCLWLTFGFVGAHKFYVGKTKIGCIYCALGYLGLGGWLVPLFGFIGPGIHIPCSILLALFLFIDLFTIPRQVRKKRAQPSAGPGQAPRRGRSSASRGGFRVNGRHREGRSVPMK